MRTAGLALAALALAAWGLLGDVFRDAEGALAASACVPLALAAAAALLARAVARGWAAAGTWLALGLVGQALQLQLYHQGKGVGYPHLWPLELSGLRAVAWAGLGLQAVLVAPAAARRAGPALRALAGGFGPWRLALLAAVLFLAGTKLFRPAPAYALELVLVFGLHALQLATLLLGATALPDGAVDRWRALAARVLGPEGDDEVAPARLDRFAWTLAAWAFAAAAFLGWAAYQQHPHVPDEVAYLLHANYLADGRLFLPPPPVPAGFDVDLMFLHDGRWYSPVPIGWPAVLAVGARLGVPWLVNPALGAASVLLAYLFLSEVAPRRTARGVALLLAFTPWATFLNMSLMTHSLTLASALLAALGAARAGRPDGTGRAAWAWLGGAGLGVVGLIRPLEGLIVAGLLGLWGLGLGGRRLRLPAFAGLVLAAAAVGALGLAYNAALTGSPTKFPIMDYVDEVYGPGKNSLGFGPDKGLGWGGLDPFPGHGLRDVLANTNFNVFLLDFDLFGWSTGSLWLLLVPLVLTRLRSLSGLERWMLAAIAAVVGLHALYWFSGGPDFGARYWYLVLVPCLVLTVGGLRRLGDALFPGEAGARSRARLLAAVAVLCGWSLCTYFPWRALDRYRHYRGMRPEVRALAREHGFGRSLVLVRGERHPDYASAAACNPVDLEADATVYAWDRDAATRRALLEHYGDRDVWVLAGPSVTGRGFELVDGPRAAAELLAQPGEAR